MRTGKNISRIFIHCSAGYGNVDSMRRFWRSMGWRSDGYHTVISENGSITRLQPFSVPVNGVRGQNAHSIHICYIGGVERNNVNVAKDTRTPQQRKGLLDAINEALDWVRLNGGNVSNVIILGHRDASPDRNGNGVIDSWERIKQCPSFDAIPEYRNVIPMYLKSFRK